jgi:lysine-N-methylase
MGVLVDKTTYEKYQKFPEGDLRSLVQLHLSLNTVGASDTLYAKIEPSPSNQCPFLAADHLCGVQKEFGSEYLSATCSIYPRVLNWVNGELETSLYLSCPEAARLVLLHPESTQAEGNVASSHFRTDQFSRLASDNGAIHKPFSYFDQVQALVVTVIQDRTRPMWQRLFLLGTLCCALDEIKSAEQDPRVPELIRDYLEIIATGALRVELERIPETHATQFDIVLRLTDQRIRAGGCNNRFLECWEAFLQGIDYSTDSTPTSCAQRYEQAEEEFFRPFFAQHQFILENYLLNYVFRTLFPFGREASAHHTPQGILGEYMLMITQYTLIKGLLIGMAGHYREAFSTEHVVKLIQSFSKSVEHSPTFLKGINEFIKSRNLGTVQGFAILLASSEKALKDIAEVAGAANFSPLVA